MFLKAISLVVFLHILGQPPTFKEVHVASYEECIQKGLDFIDTPVETNLPYSQGFACQEKNLPSL
jgi:hypothetical protein